MAYETLRKRSERFDGAGRGRRAEGWTTGGTSPRIDQAEVSVLRARSRDLRRNNPYARRAVDAIVSNAVGGGIKARIRRKNGSTHARLQAEWDQWSSSTEVDADGRCTFAGLQRLVLAATVESGEAFVRLRRRRLEDGLSTPIQLQALEADFLDEAIDLQRQRSAVPQGNRVVQGIELDRLGRRVAYWMHRDHPASVDNWLLRESTNRHAVRVPADEVAHLFRIDRPGQMRGIPWMAPVLTRLHDLDAYEDAQLERQRVASLFAAFVNDDTGSLDPSVAAAAQAWEIPDDLEPGGLLELPPGRKVEFSDPPEASGYADYLRASLHAVGVGIGVPYMLLTGDLSSANFSSSRMGRLEFQRQIREWHEGLLIPFCNQVFSWWISARGYSEGQTYDGITVEWSPPRPELVDPQKETSALAERIRNGLTSYPRALREQGDDPDAVLAEIAEWNETIDALGVVLDCDPRNQSKAGQAQVGDSSSADDEAQAPEPDEAPPEEDDGESTAVEDEQQQPEEETVE
jgi:lambda family phage portal protein